MLNGHEFKQTPGVHEVYREPWHGAVHGIAESDRI